MPFPILLGIGSLISSISSATNVALGKSNTEKAQKLQIDRHQEIAIREKERIETQEKIEYARLMCQRIQQQESLLVQTEQRDLDRQSQSQLAELSRGFQSQQNALNRDSQRLQHQENLLFQGYQRNLDRQLQRESAELSRDFQSRENALNRDLQLTLVELNQEFQVHQGKISRDFAEKIEIFKADLQKYFFEQQRILQIELKAQDIALARELRQFDRQTAISVVQEQKRQNSSPIWLVAEDLLSRGNTADALPLHVFFSPPTLKYDRNKENSDTKGFPIVENYLQDRLRKLFQKYQVKERSNDYLAGAWTSNQFASEAAARQIFLGLKGEPTLILESNLEGENISIGFAYWGLGYVKERYMVVMSFSWGEMLYDFAKNRTETWFRNRAEEGTSEAEWIADYGEETVRKYQANQAIAEREQKSIARGEDIREIPRKYHLAPKDYDELKHYIAIYHCLIAGWIADEYFLLGVSPDRRQLPLLPELFPELLAGTSVELQEQICAESVVFYQDLYQRLLGEIPDWQPELRLELATSLAKLPSREAAIEEINASLTAWLSYRGIDWQPSEPVLPLLATVAKPEDEGYFCTLYNAWQLVGITDEVNMGDAYYRRGEDFFKRGDYGAAIADFDRALNLDHPEATLRKQEAESELNRPKYQAIKRFK